MMMKQIEPEIFPDSFTFTYQVYINIETFLFSSDSHAFLFFRWNIVVHGGIDGSSRLVPHLTATTDNLAASALRVFISGLREYGVPSGVRVDGGSEFNFVRDLMNFINGEGRHSAIVGPSVHNQRIKRLWQDVFAKVLDKYYKLFYHMEDHHILVLENDIHMYCLHHVFVPRLQRNLTQWTSAHNNHALRTERHQTPIQLWFTRNLQSAEQNSTAMNNLFRRNLDEINRTIATFMDTTELSEPDDIVVVLPRVARPMTNVQYDNLLQSVDVLGPSRSSGIDIYGRVVRYVTECIQ